MTKVRFFRVPKESMPPLIATLSGKVKRGQVAGLKLEISDTVPDVGGARDIAVDELDRFFKSIRKRGQATASTRLTGTFTGRVHADRTVELAFNVDGAGPNEIDLRSQMPIAIAWELEDGVQAVLRRGGRP